MVNLESTDKEVEKRVKEGLLDDLQRKFFPICVLFSLYNFFRIAQSVFRKDDKIRTMFPVFLTFLIILIWFFMSKWRREYTQYLVFVNLLRIYVYQCLSANDWIDVEYQSSRGDASVITESLIYGLILFIFLNASTFKTTLVILPLIVFPFAFLTFHGIKLKDEDREVHSLVIKFYTYFLVVLCQ